MNRDDLIARPEAPPRLQAGAQGGFIGPLEMQSGGTWIGVNASGLVACLLNRYDGPAPVGALSRGMIVPTALEASTVAAASTGIAALALGRFAPFTCIVISAREHIRMDWTGRELLRDETATNDAHQAWMTTSSSIAPQEVTSRRQALFDGTKQETDGLAALNRFHSESSDVDAWWAPWMKRDNSHTKSITRIEFAGESCALSYWDRASVETTGLGSAPPWRLSV
jgi:hypothetical protein